jgi:hypothetical protein
MENNEIHPEQIWNDTKKEAIKSAIEEYKLDKLIDKFIEEYQQDGMLPSVAKKRILDIIKSNNKVFAFMYCPCIHESAWATVSLHRDRKSAETAMVFHKENERLEHERLYSNLSEEERNSLYVEFGTMEAWDVNELTIL